MAETNISQVASLIGDPARARMLLALMGGRALTASELASEAEITAQTASSHLSKLIEHKLLRVRKQGRHKYFQLHGADVAELIEKLLSISTKLDSVGVSTGPRDPELRKARVCYDHLAGELSVSLYDSIKKRGYLQDDGETRLTEEGMGFFSQFGIDWETLKRNKRSLCKSCLDWSERRDHLAGSLGKWILSDILHKKWAQRDLDSRVIRFSDKGLLQFRRRYKI